MENGNSLQSVSPRNPIISPFDQTRSPNNALDEAFIDASLKSGELTLQSNEHSTAAANQTIFDLSPTPKQPQNAEENVVSPNNAEANLLDLTHTVLDETHSIHDSSDLIQMENSQNVNRHFKFF